MSNLINTNYAVNENKAHEIAVKPVSYNSAMPQFRGVNANDSYESARNKKRKRTIGIILMSVIVAAVTLGGICLYKGGKTLGKKAKFGEKLKQGWNELIGKGKNAVEKTPDKPELETTNPAPPTLETKEDEIINQNLFELSDADKETAARIKNGRLLPAPKTLLNIETTRSVTSDGHLGKQFANTDSYKENIAYVQGRIDAEQEANLVKEAAIQAQKAKEAEEMAVREGEEYLKKEEEALERYKAESDKRNAAWLKEQEFLKGKDRQAYIDFWNKSMAVMDKKEAYINWFKEDQRLMNYFKLTEADIDNVVCDGNCLKITKQNGTSIRYYPNGIDICESAGSRHEFIHRVNSNRSGCFAVGKESLLDKLEQKTAGMNSVYRTNRIDSVKELNGVRFVKVLDDAILTLHPDKNMIVRFNNGSMIHICADKQKYMSFGDVEIKPTYHTITKAFDSAFIAPTEIKGSTKYSFKDSFEIKEEHITLVGDKKKPGNPPEANAVAVLTPKAKQKRINNMIKRYVELHPEGCFEKCSKDCVIFRDGVKETVHIVYEGLLYDIDSKGRVLSKVIVHENKPITFIGEYAAIAEARNSYTVRNSVSRNRSSVRQPVSVRR